MHYQNLFNVCKSLLWSNKVQSMSKYVLLPYRYLNEQVHITINNHNVELITWKTIIKHKDSK